MGSSAPDPRQGEIFAPGTRENARERSCRLAECGRTLSGQQKDFCSRRCCSTWWDREHPRMNRGPEGPREGTIRNAILGYLADGAWRTKAEIAFHVRAHEHSVGSRLSELRRKGFRIESDSPNGCSRRSHRFRLVLG